MKRRLVTLLAAAAMAVAMLAAPAAAHNLHVTPNGQGNGPADAWVGALALPGQGQGLMHGGPRGAWTISPAPFGGLNTACENLESNPSAADIRGPADPFKSNPDHPDFDPDYDNQCPHGQ